MGINLKNKKTLANINNVFNRRNDAIRFVDDYGPMILEAKRKGAKGEETEQEPEPTPKQVLQPTKQKASKLKLAQRIY